MGPRLQRLEGYTIKSELDYILHFLPIQHIKEVVIPNTNKYAKKQDPRWIDIDFDEVLHVLGLLIAMEVYEIHSPRRLYWSPEVNNLFPAMDFGKVMTCRRFETILKYLQLSNSDNENQQILDFVAAINETFQNAITPGTYLTLDESMIKSFHRNLKGKIKIIRKPHPIGNEIKNMADAVTKIVMNMELYEGKEYMKEKDHVKEYGATTATTIWLTAPYHGTGHRIIADSWFGSVKTAVALSKRGLYSIMLVKTAHKDFPRLYLSEKTLDRGEWVACSTEKDGVKLQACRFRDLQIKDFISTCSTSIPGAPRVTKHHGNVPRPQVAEHYLKYSAAIDVHNHNRSGSVALEDIWHTKNPLRCQFAGILGFCFTNSYLGMKHFCDRKIQHHFFKMAAAHALTSYKTTSMIETRVLNQSATVSSSHTLEKLPNSRRCYMCQHGYLNRKKSNISTTFKCGLCAVPVCKPSKGDCWEMHLKGLPKKRRETKS